MESGHPGGGGAVCVVAVPPPDLELTAARTVFRTGSGRNRAYAEHMIDVLGAPAEILQLRLANQHLAQQRSADPRAMVAHLGAVQSQDYSAALWALGLRVAKATRESLECAFNRGAILRTHVLRPTWHFVTPEDIRWMLALTAPRIKRAMASRDRELGLNDELVAQTNGVIAQALAGGTQLTRPELGTALQAAGITVADGAVLAHLVSHAELDSVVCSGALRGKQHTYALLEERAPRARVLERDEAVAELVCRYF